MLTYLTKFNNLPKAIHDKINAPEVMTHITELGQEYNINLASIVMRVMVGEVKLDGLAAYLINELGLPAQPAKDLELKLRRGVFSNVIDFLLGADQGAKLIFSETDEKEVRSSKKDLTAPHFDNQIDGFVEDIVKQSRLNFTDPLAAGKFRQVMKTYLRGSRDKLATTDALTKASELGGVALTHDSAERVLIIASNFLKKNLTSHAIAPAKIKLPTEKSFSLQTEEYDLASSLLQQGKLKKPVSLDPSHELMPLTPTAPSKSISVTPSPQTVSKRVLKNVIASKKIDKQGLRHVAAAIPPITSLPKSSTGKVRMDDIRYTVRALSPVEELRFFTLTNFRRLDPDPVKGVEKIKAKMELLGNENYSKKIEAIVAWHESPLNKLYVAVCRRSLDENVPVASILEREIKKDKNFIQPQELSAIISLNRSLKF